FDSALFHLLHRLLHPLTVLVVWRIARLIIGGTAPACVSMHERPASSPYPSWVEWAAGGGALLFAVHPLQVEAVAWATGFKDVLCGFLSCVAIWQYLRYAQTGGEVTLSGQPSDRRLWYGGGRYWLPTGGLGGSLLCQ